MRRTLLFTLLSASAIGCADTAEPLDGLAESDALALEGPWIDDPITPPQSADPRGRPGLGEPGEERPHGSDPWLDPPLTPPRGTPAGSGGTTPAAPSGARYDFESSSEGWTRSGQPIARIEPSTAVRASGRASLAVDIDGAGNGIVSVPNPPLRAGATVSFAVFIPAGARLSWVQPFVQQDQSTNWLWTGNWQPLAQLRENSWNRLTVQAPANARSFASLGVQIETAGSWRGRIYIDDVRF